jgi:hypothetical protein
MRSTVSLAIAAALLLAAAAPASADVKVLSTRADLVSGGDALVQVTPPGARVELNGRDVTAAFGNRPDGRYVGLLEGLRLGENEVVAGGERLTITNHPIGGPIFAGPQIKPWQCASGALDTQCNRQPKYEFFYRSTRGGDLRAYNPDSPPSDVGTTTTDQGKTVPFIVRQETGVIDRDEYRIAVLFDPKKPWTHLSPQEQFNHKMVVFHGASCNTEYRQAAAPDVLNETALGRGFVTMSHALNNAGHNCNIVTQAESMIMTKERVIERYGPLRYTIGSGCSGGSLVQQQVANAWPGFYQGVTPACSFTDAWSSAMQYVNYQLLRRYYENPSRWAPGVVWTPDQRAAVEGHPNPANSVTFTEVIPSSGEPTRDCPGVPDDQVYHEKTNPKGVRCTFQDYMVNVFGKRKEDGFAGRPLGNIGLEYGRKALEAGRITPQQFVDVNAKIGSFSMDYDPIPERTDADRPALRNVYRSGAVNTAENLDQVAIIDLRGPDPGAFHDVYRTYTMRARLEREHGTAANQILWRGQVPLFGDVNYVDQSIVAVDEWLANVEKDPRATPLARKILEDKPKTLTDRCTDGQGRDIPKEECDAQIEAGMPATDDNLRCTLKPLRRTDYGAIVFTDAQWEQMKKTFPNGVCDFSKPGEDRVRTNTWQTYQDEDGDVIYGGRPLGPAPRSVPLGAGAASTRATLGLAGGRQCVSRRRFRLTLRAPRGQRLRSATVYVDGKRVRRVTGRRATAPIDLRGVRKKTVRVRVVMVTRSGKRYVAERRYRTCTPKQRGPKRRAAAKRRD